MYKYIGLFVIIFGTTSCLKLLVSQDTPKEIYFMFYAHLRIRFCIDDVDEALEIAKKHFLCIALR